MNHSRRAGDSKYPVVAGNVLKLLTPRRIFNPHINAECDHDVYLWVMKLLRGRGKLQPKHKPVKIFRVEIPRIPEVGEKYLSESVIVQKETVVKWIKTYGVETVARRVNFNDNRAMFKTFFIAVGLLKLPPLKPRKSRRKTPL